MKSRLSLFVSLGAAVVAAMAVSFYLSGREAELLEQSAMQDVVVATEDILAHTVVDERLVQVVQVPQKYLQPTALSSLTDVVGRVTAVPVPAGGQLTGVALLEGGGVGLAFEVPRGMRAFTIAASDVTGVAGLIQPGNFVDIVGTFEYGVPTGSVGGEITYRDEKTETITLAQNVQVLAVGRTYRSMTVRARRQAPAAEEGEEDVAGLGAEPEADEVFQNVTLLVDPALVQELVLSQQIGTLTLSLRSNLDSGELVQLDRLDPLKMLDVPIPVKSRPRPSWREIRGVTQ